MIIVLCRMQHSNIHVYRIFSEYRWSLKITLMVLLNYFLFLIIFSSCLLTRTHTLYVILNNLFFYKWWKEEQKCGSFTTKKVIIESHKRKLHTAILAHFLSLEKYTLLLIKYFPSLQNKSKFSLCGVIFATHQHHLYSVLGR